MFLYNEQLHIGTLFRTKFTSQQLGILKTPTLHCDYKIKENSKEIHI